MVPRPIHVQGPSLGPVSVRGCLQRQLPPAGQGRLSLQALLLGSVRDIKSMILGRPKRRLPRSSLQGVRLTLQRQRPIIAVFAIIPVLGVFDSPLGPAAASAGRHLATFWQRSP